MQISDDGWKAMSFLAGVTEPLIYVQSVWLPILLMQYVAACCLHATDSCLLFASACAADYFSFQMIVNQL